MFYVFFNNNAHEKRVETRGTADKNEWVAYLRPEKLRPEASVSCEARSIGDY